MLHATSHNGANSKEVTCLLRVLVTRIESNRILPKLEKRNESKSCRSQFHMHFKNMSTNNNSSNAQPPARTQATSSRRLQQASPSDIAEAASILTAQRYPQQQQPPSQPLSSPLVNPLQLGYGYASHQPPLALPGLPSTLNSGLLLPTNAVANSSIYGSQALPFDTTGTNVFPPPNFAATGSNILRHNNSQMDMSAIVLTLRAREASLMSARAHLRAQIARAQLEDLTAILGQHSSTSNAQHSSTSNAPVSAPNNPSSREQGEKSSGVTKRKESKKKKKPSRKKSLPDDAPRRPLSAYNYFYIDERERILQQKYEEAGTVSEAATVADPIKNVKGDDTCKDEYEIEMSEPVREMLERQKTRPNEGRRRPHRKRHGVVSFQELAKTIASRWRSLPADRVQYYRKIASFDLRRYQAQVFDYNQNKLRREGASFSPNEAARKSEVPKAA